MLKNIIIIIISLCVWLLSWYIIRIDSIWDKLPSLWSDTWYYHIETFSAPLSWQLINNFIMSFFSPYYDRYSEADSVDGLRYCSMIEENTKELPDTLWIYLKVWNDIIYEWNRITSCTDCVISSEIPNLLFDGEKTFYREILLSGFDYDNFTVLSDTDSVFTDKNNVYYQWILLQNMDWNTFEQPNRSLSVYKDKNYTYTVLPWKIIERTYNNSWNIESI